MARIGTKGLQFRREAPVLGCGPLRHVGQRAHLLLMVGNQPLGDGGVLPRGGLGAFGALDGGGLGPPRLHRFPLQAGHVQNEECRHREHGDGD
jgi:hypothetical protein